MTKEKTTYKVEFCEELPISGEEGILYLVGPIEEEPVSYKAWFWENDKWNFLNSNLSNYYTKDEADSAITTAFSNKINGNNCVVKILDLTREEYNNIEEKDPLTLYVVETPPTILDPEIEWYHNVVYIIDENIDSTIYYRLNQIGDYQEYENQFIISADTFVETYAKVSKYTGNVVSGLCEYEVPPVIPDPVISCEKNIVTITDSDSAVTILYKIDDNGYEIYTEPFEITGNCTVSAFGMKDNWEGSVVSEYFEYFVESPVITFFYEDEYNKVKIVAGVGSTIYYRLNGGNYQEYLGGTFIIYDDTLVEAYAKQNGYQSEIVSETCIVIVEAPTMTCTNNIVKLVFGQPGNEPYYRINSTGLEEFVPYYQPFAITGDSLVEAYSVLHGGNKRSELVSEMFYLLVPDPVIVYSDYNFITITDPHSGVTIYYRLNQSGEYQIYSGPINITATTYVECYASLYGKPGNVVEQECQFNNSFNEYLTIEALGNGNIKFISTNSTYTKTISYSKDSGNTWSSITSNTNGANISVSAGDSVLLKGSNSTYCQNPNWSGYQNNVFSITDCDVNVRGNIMSLVYGDDFIGKTSVSEPFAFNELFEYCHIIDSSKLVLPATTITHHIYRYLFKGCTKMTSTIKYLPSLRTYDGSYEGMFMDCSMLTKAIDILPATTFDHHDYYNMFSGCLSLVKAPVIAYTEALKTACYEEMFYNCKSLEVAPDILSTNFNASSCCQRMFYGCSKLRYVKCMATGTFYYNAINNWMYGVAANGTFVKNPSKTWQRGYSGIPNNWEVVNA